jgi:hypothetical protein
MTASLPFNGAPSNLDQPVIYFSARSLCCFVLPLRAISIKRRNATERDGLPGCCIAHVQ